MEFDFQKGKSSQFILDQLMTPHHRSTNDMRGIPAIPDFHQPQIESTPFPGLMEFHAPNQSHIPQFMFEQESPSSYDENFLLTHTPQSRKDDSDKNQKKSYQPLDSFFYSNTESPQNVPSPGSDFPTPSQFNQQSFPLQNKTATVEKENRHQQLPEKSATSDLPMHEKQSDGDVLQNQTQGDKSHSPKVTNPPSKDKSFNKLKTELNEFSKSYTKLSTEKAELEKQISRSENNLKEYREQAYQYKNKYKEAEEKLNEEIKNREMILSQVENVNGMSQLLDKHFKDICNTLKLYVSINNEYKEHNAKLHDYVDKGVKDYECVLSNYKSTIEKLRCEGLKTDKKLQETATEFLKIKENLTQQIEDTKMKLSVEQGRSSSLQNELLACEKQNENLIQKCKQSEHDFSEKYSFLENKLAEAQSKLEILQKDHAELKIYETKYNQLEAFLVKLQKEKEALSTILDTSQQNLSKSEIDRSEQQKCLENLHLERQKMNEDISKLKDECADLNLKLQERNMVHELLINDTKELKEKYMVACENLEIHKEIKMKLEEEIKEVKKNSEMSENIKMEIKSQLQTLQKELDIAKEEIMKKTGNILFLEERISTLQSELEELYTTQTKVKEILAEREGKIKDLTDLNSSLQSDLKGQEELNKQILEELDKTKIEMANTRQEMLTSMDQYRAQYMNQLKENENKQKELLLKYENSCSELENTVKSKKQCDAEILNLKRRIKEYEKKVQEMDDITEKIMNEKERKENEYNEKCLKLENSLTELNKEKIILENTISNLKQDAKSSQDTENKIVTLEKNINNLQHENEELKEKLKTAEKVSKKEDPIYSQTETLKFPGSLPSAPRKRIHFEEEFSDASSIDVPKFFKLNTPSQPSRDSPSGSEKDDLPKSRRTQRNRKIANNGRKFFKKSFSGFEDSNIFG